MKINLVGRGDVYDYIISTLPIITPIEHPWDQDGDLLVCSGYSNTIRMETIISYPRGVINIHTSMLPKYRGRHPVDWAMEKQEKEIGITIHYIDDETIDTGDIILQDSVSYIIGEGYNSLMNKIINKVPQMLFTVIKQIGNECVYRRKQNEEVASYYPKRTAPRIY